MSIYLFSHTDWYKKYAIVQNFLDAGDFLPLKVVLILANSAAPDEMQRYCLPKHSFWGFQYISSLQGTSGKFE